MLRKSILLLFLLPSLAYSQTMTVGDSISQGQVDEAKKTIEAAGPKVLQLNVGEFEVIEPAKGVTAALLWLSTDDKLISRIEIPAGQPFSTWMVRRGEKVARHHVFQSKPYAWSVLVGATQGHGVTTLIKSADKPELAPLVVDRIDVTVGKPGPTPGPEPGPGPVPIPSEGLRVIIIYESKDLSNLPSAQVAAMNSKEVREYLNAKCIKVNNQPEWRVWDKDIDASRESTIWQDALKRPRQSVPWLIVSNGKDGYEGPLPADTAALMAVLKKFGGN